MKALIYDESFEGLLTSIYDAFYIKENLEGIFRNDEFIPDLLTEAVPVTTSNEKHMKVLNAISDKISRDAIENIYYAYLSELPGISKSIYAYVKLGFKLGNKIDMYLNQSEVSTILKARSKVTWEVQRFVGFVRFTLLGDIYYGKIEPDHNISELLAPHFAARLPLEKWVIHDTKRNIAAIHSEGKYMLSYVDNNELSSSKVPKDVDIYEKLWRDYFVSLAINERENPKCQANHLPLRYRKNLTEFL